MDQPKPKINADDVQELYDEMAHWHVNLGDETIHAKRMPGRFRKLKWFTASLWLIFFLGPYLRWDGQQAILFDIPNRQFHLFDITVHPQDVWMLSLVLILLAMILFGVTAIAGRVFCGYFCFQTIWTDVFTLIEEKIEGPPAQRRRLDKAPMSFDKARRKGLKHLLWLAIAVLTGISFAAYFTDAFQLWRDVFTLNGHIVAYIVLLMFTLGTYFLAGYLREQVCFWLCPYARIQGVMYDKDTILPTYDVQRGEPRGKLKADNENLGDCIDCRMCVAVCPTGVDIRNGQQEGCITCGLCIDACDSIMDKVGRSRGLIRYASLREMAGDLVKSPLKRPRVIVYATIMLLAFGGILYGLTNISPIDWHILHQRQPLYTVMSDGSVQNRYTFKILNKTEQAMQVRITTQGVAGVEVSGLDQVLALKADKLVPFNVDVRVMPAQLAQEHTPITFVLQDVDQPDRVFTRESVIIRPPR